MVEDVERLFRLHSELERIVCGCIGDGDDEAIGAPVPEQAHVDAAVAAAIELGEGASCGLRLDERSRKVSAVVGSS
jgi:hypothetical protein